MKNFVLAAMIFAMCFSCVAAADPGYLSSSEEGQVVTEIGSIVISEDLYLVMMAMAGGFLLSLIVLICLAISKWRSRRGPRCALIEKNGKLIVKLRRWLWLKGIRTKISSKEEEIMYLRIVELAGGRWAEKQRPTKWLVSEESSRCFPFCMKNSYSRLIHSPIKQKSISLGEFCEYHGLTDTMLARITEWFEKKEKERPLFILSDSLYEDGKRTCISSKDEETLYLRIVELAGGKWRNGQDPTEWLPSSKKLPGYLNNDYSRLFCERTEPSKYISVQEFCDYHNITESMIKQMNEWFEKY